MTTTAQPTTVGTRRLRRAGSVVAAALGAAVVWLIASAAGVDFLLSDSMGAVTISLPVVLIFSAVFGVLGWASLAVLERFTRRSRAVWTIIAAAVLALSLPPIFLEDATTGTKIALVLVHTAVAAVLIPALRRDAKA
ncbi:DUF6069 family protein [Kutzneria sp. CA-103260]|uniref:DUF6069 family protein n=1 Tax=Kutzneria sp. CA-103260 TaxID=2802641 RepID=UPI001BAB66F7|nr:DUF6069 family protein [Kutzneria sp. CA-103260]QUQ65609.1 hypothetical protein JJ691_33330 [Kutzneria sp. CA-103260]